MPLPVAKFVAVWPKDYSVNVCAIFDDGAAKQRKFDVSIEAVRELSDWLIRDERTQIALVTGGIPFPWADHPTGRRFDFTPGGPTLEDWIRFRSSYGFPSVRAFEIFQPIHLALADKAAVFCMSREVVEALSAPAKGPRDPPWLAGLLRDGQLRWLYPNTLLYRLCEWLVIDDRWAVEECVAFLELNSRGHWHNRARAKMARRLKHCSLSDDQRERVTRTILGRLEEGDFSEQFRDQLKLTLHLDRKAALAAALRASASDKDYVRRLANWVLRDC